MELTQDRQTMPLKMVGSTKFGRYPKISDEQSINIIQTDDFMVGYAGHLVWIPISPNGEGRGLFSSVRGNFMIGVFDDGVFVVKNKLEYILIARIPTNAGKVWIDENEKQEIAICDQLNIYIYNYNTGVFATSNSNTIEGFIPGSICYQNGVFLATDSQNPRWFFCDSEKSLNWPSENAVPFQTKGNIPQAIVRFPGKGNLLAVIGQSITETWVNNGAPIIPYQKNTYQNIDYGTVSASTIDSMDNMIIWLGSNEKSGLTIMYTTGGDVQNISTDGIDYKLSQLKHPESSYGFLIKQAGKLFYQLTFPKDNISWVLDVELKQFYTLTDEYMNYHIAKQVVFFDNNYFFISFNDGNIYQMSSDFDTYNGADIPCIRIPPTLRLPDGGSFIANFVSFPLEMGTESSPQSIDLSISKNGGESFGNVLRTYYNPKGIRQNKYIQYSLGRCNEFTAQFRFVGKGRIVFTDGIMGYYQ